MLDRFELSALIEAIQNNKLEDTDYLKIVKYLEHYQELCSIIDNWKWAYQKPAKEDYVLGLKTIISTFDKQEEQDMVDGWSKNKNEELKKIVLAKCDEREKKGYDNLTDSDIMDILEECDRKHIKYTRKDLEELGLR